MRPERVAALVRMWVRAYTRTIPPPIARRRIDEVDADLHDHIAHERARGTSDRRIAAAIASRLVRGLAADAAWRRRKASGALARAVLRVGVGVAAILAVPFVAMQVTSQVVWSLADYVAAGALLTTIGVALELALRRAGSRTIVIGIAVLGAAAAILGNADDGPGLVLLGIALVASACALGVRIARRAG
jgi:hypothetical protein